MVYFADPSRVTQQETTEASPAYAALPTCEQWPRSGASCPPPTAVRVLADVDKNGEPDHIVTVRVSIEDVNNNGRFDIGTDRLVLAPEKLERFDRNAPLCFTPADWRDAVRKAREQL